MSDVFRCDYCGQHRPLHAAQLYFVDDDRTTDDGDTVYTVAIGCGNYCARQLVANANRIGGR